ncbi:MAG: hypothetical protein LLG42_04500 [Chloroflexi bacterium]|nr:hypothetical protein [Chloroflexota bacterium]
MNSRERVLTALNHKEPDRVPFDLGETAVPGSHRAHPCHASTRTGKSDSRKKTTGGIFYPARGYIDLNV